jgi:hypothetical protein
MSLLIRFITVLDRMPFIDCQAQDRFPECFVMKSNTLDYREKIFLQMDLIFAEWANRQLFPAWP